MFSSTLVNDIFLYLDDKQKRSVLTGTWTWGWHRHFVCWAILCEPGGVFNLAKSFIYLEISWWSFNLSFIYIQFEIPQEDFFIILHDILAEMEEVTELQPVPDAHVPVMRFKFQGISIDLLYASISLLVVPDVSL